MSYRELVESQEFDAIEPIGQRKLHDDVRVAMATAWLINVQIDTKRGKAISPLDVLPWLADEVDMRKARPSKRVRRFIDQIMERKEAKNGSGDRNSQS